MTDHKVDELESSLKDMQENYDVSKQSWDKEKAVLNQRLEFLEYQLDDERKKFEENKNSHESVLKSLQSSNRESVVGREEAQLRINDMEEQFVQERKKQEE